MAKTKARKPVAGFEIRIADDDTIEYVSHFRKGRGSLSALGASALCDPLNRFNRAQLIACAIAVRSCPFPLGSEREVLASSYRVACEMIAEGSDPSAAFSIGELRRSMCLEWCHGMNAPGDSYVRAMASMLDDGTLPQDWSAS